MGIDPAIEADASLNKQRKVLFIQFTNPAGYPPLEHSSRILADDQWQVTFLGTGAMGASQLIIEPHPKIRVHLIAFVSGGVRQKLQYLRYCLWTLAWVLFWRPNVVYCSDLMSTPIGAFAQTFFRTAVVYHEHDTPVPQSHWFSKFLFAARKRLASRAFLFVCPNHQRLEHSKSELKPKNALCVWNCPNRREVLRSKPIDDSKGLVLWFHGSLNEAQFPGTIIEALPLLPEDIRLRFAGYETIGHRGFIHSILQRARDLGVENRVEYVGTPSTRKSLYEAVAKADIGLVLFHRNFREPMVGASNKPFDYLACGLGILATDDREWHDFFGLCDCGRVVNPESVTDLTATILKLHQNRIHLRSIGERGRQKVLADWNYESQFEPVRALLNRLPLENTLAAQTV